MRKVLRSFLIIAMVIIATSLSACGDSETPPAEETTQVNTPKATVPVNTPKVVVQQATSPLVAARQADSPLVEAQQAVSPLAKAQSNGASAGGATNYTIEIPKPASDSAVVYGKLTVDPNSAALEIFLKGQVYLGPVVYGDIKKTPFISLDIGKDQLADPLSPDSEFIFKTAKPGKYGIIVYTPFNSYLLSRSEEEGAIMLDLEAGKSYDLGTIVIK